MLPEQDVLSKRRMEQAKQCLVSADTLLKINDLRGAVNRAYYAVFHAMRSVLILEGKDFAKHSGVISYFRREYIKTGIFTVDISDTITELFNNRSSGDYDDYFDFTEEEVRDMIGEAEQFVSVIGAYHEKR
ncbi:MAG: HEPN domain-containing protein [Acidaminococcaceae bacterium]|nr:HEPN domain-containing protein [Acidaminococcaceae bacterium]